MTRGQVHWARLDKRRPVVIVSLTSRNLLANDVLVVPCTTILRPMPWHVRLRRGEGGLPSDSMAKCEQITTLPRSAVNPEPLGGILPPERMQAIEAAMVSALGISPR
jgi:mRNA-degrading endonuclease toxin of MazEF toxin-antitoxin module